jgi:hypothetical protein
VAVKQRDQGTSACPSGVLHHTSVIPKCLGKLSQSLQGHFAGAAYNTKPTGKRPPRKIRPVSGLALVNASISKVMYGC